MKIDNQQNATINLQELHDMLAGGVLSVSDDTNGGELLPNSFILEDATIEPADKSKLDALMVEVNSMRDRIQTLDAAFHDIFDERYC